MLSRVHPPPLLEALALWLDDSAMHKPVARIAATLQLARSDLWGFMRNGELVAALINPKE